MHGPEQDGQRLINKLRLEPAALRTFSALASSVRQVLLCRESVEIASGVSIGGIHRAGPGTVGSSGTPDLNQAREGPRACRS